MKPIATLSVAALLSSGGLLLERPEAAPAAPAAPAALAAPARTAADGPVSGTFEIDAGHSSVLFGVQHAGSGRFYGRFNMLSGQIVVDAEKPERSSVLIRIDAASVDTASEGRDTHLKGPDFFNAKEFPEIFFESKSVERTAKGFEVTGELNLLGVGKSVTAEAVFHGHSETQRFGKRSGYEVVFDIKRSDFGMTWGLPNMLGDDVRIIVSVEAAMK